MIKPQIAAIENLLKAMAGNLEAALKGADFRPLVDGLKAVSGEMGEAFAKLSDGMDLTMVEGLRAQTIGVSAAKFGEVFGITDPTEAQAMSDRWSSIVGGNYAGFSDFIDTVYWP